MVEVLCVVFVLSSVFHLPLAFTLPLGNVDEAAGDLTGAMVRFFLMIKQIDINFYLFWTYCICSVETSAVRFPKAIM